MKKKALLIGARPRPFVGPWVYLEEGSWEVEPPVDFRGGILIEYQNGEEEVQRVPLIGLQTIVLKATKLRARIVGNLDCGDVHLDVRAA